MSPLLLVTGTGTGIGKTVISRGLVSAWARRGVAVAGLKPIETGPTGPTSDVGLLGQASTFHVTRFPPPYLLADPVSPHLAARRAGRSIDIGVVARWVHDVQAEAEAVVLELPGGLFSPLSDHATNANLVRALAASQVVLVAPDRLGVLHEVIATTRAGRADGIQFDGVILSAAAEADSSTGTNAAELARVIDVPVLGVLPRTSAEEIERRCDDILRQLRL
jgi:dethiobiotin synthetase